MREIDERQLEVSTEIGDTRATVRLELDRSGNIVRSLADARPRGAGAGSAPTRWGGDFSDYAKLGGLRMPTRAEVYWDLPEGRFVYWRAQVTSAEAIQQPFTI